MSFVPRLRHLLWCASVDAWWTAWLDLWGEIAWQLDPEREAHERALARDEMDAYLVDRGGHGGEAAGTGGNF